MLKRGKTHGRGRSFEKKEASAKPPHAKPFVPVVLTAEEQEDHGRTIHDDVNTCDKIIKGWVALDPGSSRVDPLPPPHHLPPRGPRLRLQLLNNSRYVSTGFRRKWLRTGSVSPSALKASQ